MKEGREVKDGNMIKNSLFVEPEKSLQMLVRDPYQDDFDARFIKEPIPYGNPFRLVVRSSGVGMEEEIHNEAEALLHGKMEEGGGQVGKKVKKFLRRKQKESNSFIIFFSINFYEYNCNNFSFIFLILPIMILF